MPSPSEPPAVGYVLKVFPRLSETFILNEIVAREQAGERVEIASLRAPTDGRFHAKLAELRAPVHWIRNDLRSAERLWAILGEARTSLPRLSTTLPELLESDVGEAVQAVELAKWAVERDIDHLHAHFATMATVVTRLASRMTGIPYSFTAHAKDIYHESVDEEVLGTAIAEAHHVVTVSDFNVAELVARFAGAATRVRRVYNGLDLETLRFRPSSLEPPSIVAVGRLVEKKGFADLIDAVSVLAARDVVVPTRIAGGGRLEPALRDQVEISALGGVVEMLGPRTQCEIITLIHSATVVVAPCVTAADGDRDGLPTVLLEAMAMGTPVIATAVTGIPEAVVDGETGLIVPERDPYALADAIERLLGDPALRTRLAVAARAMVEERFDVRVQAASLGALRTGTRHVAVTA